MTKFFNIFKKNPFLVHFWPIFPVFGAKKFFQKTRLCHAQLHMVFQQHAKIQKKLRIQFQENARTEDRRTDGRTDRPYFIRTLRLTPGLQKRLWHRCFPMNFAKFLKTPFSQNTSGRLLLCVQLKILIRFQIFQISMENATQQIRYQKSVTVYKDEVPTAFALLPD